MSDVFSLCSYKTLSVWTPPWVVCHQCRPSTNLGTFSNKTLVAYAWGERAGIRIVRMVNMTLKFCSSLKLMAHASIHIHQSRRGTSERRDERATCGRWRDVVCLSISIFSISISQARSTTSPTDANDVPPTLFPTGRSAHTHTHSLTLILLGLYRILFLWLPVRIIIIPLMAPFGRAFSFCSGVAEIKGLFIFKWTAETRRDSSQAVIEHIYSNNKVAMNHYSRLIMERTYWFNSLKMLNKSTYPIAIHDVVLILWSEALYKTVNHLTDSIFVRRYDTSEGRRFQVSFRHIWENI